MAKKKSTTKPTWAGRTSKPLADDARVYLNLGWNESYLDDADAAASIGHVEALRAARLLSAPDARKLIAALRGAAFTQETTDEDIHSALERVVTEQLGELGARLHTARSRNDLVATDLRLYVRKQLIELLHAVLDLSDALVERGSAHASTIAPGYTHLQRAQPVTLGHWLLAHAWAFHRDVGRFFSAYDQADTCPLGAGALAGNTLGVDPEVSRQALGFARTFGNSIDAVSDRDFLLDACYAGATAALHLSRLAEEIVVWSTSEFHFVRLPDSHSTGSSMMPQKRNPDVAELARAESGRATGSLVDLFMTLKSLPLAYDRDLQATKRSLETLFELPFAFAATAGMIRAIEFDMVRLREAASDEALLATDLAEALVERGVPFRTAHERVASVARRAEELGVSFRSALSDSAGVILPLELREAEALLDPDASVRRRSTPGGPSPSSVRAQVRHLRVASRRSRGRLEMLAASLPERLR